MKKNILLAMAFAIAVPGAFAQDAAPADAPSASDAPAQHRHHEGKGQRPQGPRMNPEMMGMFIIGEQLVMEKYDADKDGKLSDEEMAAVKSEVDKRREARKADMLKKYDKDGDGKISREERQGMREDWAKQHPEIAKKMEERRAEMLKKYDKDGDGKLSDEEKKARSEEMKAGRGGPRPGMGDGQRGPRRGGEGRPGAGQRGPVMVLGHDLIMEKYDTDKDGILSDSEEAVLKEDVKKAMEAKRAERKAHHGKHHQGEHHAAPAPEKVNDDDSE